MVNYSILSTLLLTLASVSSVFGGVAWPDFLPGGRVLNQWDAIVFASARNWRFERKVAFGIDGNGAFQFFYHSLALGTRLLTRQGNCPSYIVYHMWSDNVGNLRVHTDKGDCTIPSHSTISGDTRVVLEREADTRTFIVWVTVSVAGTVRTRYELARATMPNDMWPLSITHNYGLEVHSFNRTLVPTALGNGVRIYSIDGMYRQSTIYSDEFPSSPVTQVDPLGRAIHPEYYSHARDMVILTKSRYFGIAPNAEYVQVQLTAEGANYFSERRYLEALRYALNDRAPGSKLVAFYGHFTHGDSQRVLCATEILFRRNIPIIHPAGNGASNIARHNPFAFTVGAFCHGVPCENSNYGAILHIWAPGVFYSWNGYGTSIATGYTTALAASYISRWTSLANNPGVLYEHLRRTARQDQTISSHFAVKASPTAGNRVLRFDDTVAPNGASDPRSNRAATRFCHTLGWDVDHVTEGDANRIFGDMINVASTGVDGYLVNMFSARTSCPGTFRCP